MNEYEVYLPTLVPMQEPVNNYEYRVPSTQSRLFVTL
jgi:hypothetical protein